MHTARPLTAAAIAAALVLPLALGGCGKDSEAVQIQKAPAGARLVVIPGEAAIWQDVSAEITTVDQAQVLARIPGILRALTVREGDLVKRGQVIGRIVDNQLGFQAGAFGAQAAAAQAQAAQARSELKRIRFLYDKGVYAKARLEQAQAAAEAADAQVRAARQQQSAVHAVAGQGAVVAPSSGRILRADVPAGAPVAPGMAIAVVTSGPTIVRLEMPESLADRVHAGSAVRADGVGQGQVIKVYPAVSAGRIMADVAIPGVDSRLIGRRVPARVEAGRRTAILVPAAYVSTRYGIDSVTVLGKDGSAAQVPIQRAPGSEPGTIEILSGVAAGDTLIEAGGK